MIGLKPLKTSGKGVGRSKHHKTLVMLSVTYMLNAYSASKTSVLLRGDASGAPIFKVLNLY